MADPRITDRLAKTAKAAADAESLVPDREAQDYLGTLVTRAAESLGEAPSPEELRQAEEAFRRLAAVASGRDPEQLQESAAEPTRVTARQLESALLSLCPGFWPFC